MSRDAIIRITAKPRGFILSPGFSVLIILLSSFFLLSGYVFEGVCVLALMGGAVLMFTADNIPFLQVLLAASALVIRLKNTATDFFKVWPIIFPLIIFLIIRLILYPIKLKKTGVFYGMLAVSFALIAGGIGFISPQEYFKPESVFHIIMLGAGMLLLTSYFAGSLNEETTEKFDERFSRIMISLIVIIFVSLLAEYIPRFEEFRREMSVIPFQWRNNGSTLLMLAMPFPFYIASKRFGYFFFGLLCYVSILFTGSRGGLLFGTLEFGICIVAMLIIDRRHRKIYGIMVGIFAVILVLMSKYMYELLSNTIERFMDPSENSIRLGLLQRGLYDFIKHPVFGTGIGYMGNRDIHRSAKYALCWYHCSVVQVPASMGVAGILAYLFLNIQRIKVFIKNISLFNITLFISFIGLEMMSLVNPGLFAPVPYLLMISLYFPIMESVKQNTVLQNKEETQ